MMAEHIPLFLACTFAVLNWLAVSVWQKWKIIEYIAKPATMICLIAWFVIQTGLQSVTLWFGIGLILSLAGDILLLLFFEQLIGGLIAFLLAHIAYVIGFILAMGELSWMWSVIFIVILGISWVWLMRRIVGGVRAKGLNRLAIPVQVYGLVISVMLFFALLTLSMPGEWDAIPAVMVSLGALLFYVSDILLAWNKFIHLSKHGRLMNMAAYHLGQVALAVGVVLQFVG